jgi:hypothetical protein
MMLLLFKKMSYNFGHQFNMHKRGVLTVLVESWAASLVVASCKDVKFITPKSGTATQADCQTATTQVKQL